MGEDNLMVQDPDIPVVNDIPIISKAVKEKKAKN